MRKLENKQMNKYISLQTLEMTQKNKHISQ